MSDTAAPPPRNRVKTLLCWMLFLDASVALSLSLLTAFMSPLWLGWVMGMVVPELAHWLALLTVCFAISAWLLRRGHPVLTGTTLALCLAAFVLFTKPAAQAFQLGRTLPAQLSSAFGATENPPPRPPFSLARALVPRAPEPVPIETMPYARGLLLDFYRPITTDGAVPRAPVPCVVVIHGGSWVSGNRMDNGTTRPLNDHLARRGYAIASIDYRIAPEDTWPAQRDDLLDAIAFLRSRAAELNIDPQRFVLLGRSAGAQMATAGAYFANDHGIRGVVAIYPPTDMRRTWDVSTLPGQLDHQLNLAVWLGGTPTNAAAEHYDTASAVTLVTPEAPPTLILHGRLDVNVFHEQADRLASRLAAARVPHAVVSLPWAAHAFDLVGFDTPGGQITTYAVDHFVSVATR